MPGKIKCFEMLKVHLTDTGSVREAHNGACSNDHGVVSMFSTKGTVLGNVSALLCSLPCWCGTQCNIQICVQLNAVFVDQESLYSWHFNTLQKLNNPTFFFFIIFITNNIFME